MAEDVAVFYEQQLDEDAVRMAAFEPRESREEFFARWQRIIGSDQEFARAVLVDGVLAGNIGSWPVPEGRMVGYWLGREFWGRGVATSALRAFLTEDTSRPLHAIVATHNVASKRVLEKNGFVEVERRVAEDGVEEYLTILR